MGVADDVILKGSTSCRRLVLLLWIVAEIASQNIIEAWKRKFQVLPAYIIANSGEGAGGAEHKAVCIVRSWCMLQRQEQCQMNRCRQQAVCSCAQSRVQYEALCIRRKNKQIIYSKGVSGIRFLFVVRRGLSRQFRVP